MSPRNGQAASRSPGLLLAIGGAEDRNRERAMLRTFAEAAGGPAARLLVFAVLPESGSRFEDLLGDLGPRSVARLPLAAGGGGEPGTPETSALDRLAEATGLLVTGGSPLRIAAALGGTLLGEAVRRRHAAGMVVAGIGAGAAVLAGRMVLEGTGARRTPQAAAGLGLVEGLFFDPQVRPRDRMDRLLAGLLAAAVPLAVGIDADTVAAIHPDGVLLALGNGAVTLARAGQTVPGPAGGALPPASLGVQLDILVAGCRYDLRKRHALPPLSTAPGSLLSLAEPP
jgi:cyanophycinase